MAKTLTASEISGMVANRLRDMADDIEKITAVEITRYHTYDMWCTLEDARKIMGQTPGGWRKEYLGAYVVYTKVFGDNEWPLPDIRLTLTVNRNEVCRKVVTGKKIIPAQPEREVEEFEWDCGPDDGIPAVD